MSQNFDKLTIIFLVTQTLFTVLLLKHVTFAEPELTFNNRTLQQVFSPPLVFKENLTQVFADAHVVGYVDEWVEPRVRWPFELSSKIWNYVKATYGNFGNDEHLYVFLHSFNETLLHKNYLNIQLLLSNVTYLPNVVECRSDSGWEEINEFDGILCLATQVSDLVMKFSKETVDTDFLLDMRNGVNLEIKWHSIFVYYFLLKCDQKQLAASYIQTSLTASHSSEQLNGSYWMRDWFFPIYSRYGGANVINTFFENKAKYFPNTMSKMQYSQYKRKMTVGEFVHFWSGAANVNLRDQFSKIVNWDVDLEAQLRKAQMDFPQMKYLCPSCGENSGKNIHGKPKVNSEITSLPKMSVHFEEVHNLSRPNYNANTKRAPVYLYEPSFKSLGHPPPHIPI